MCNDSRRNSLKLELTKSLADQLIADYTEEISSDVLVSTPICSVSIVTYNHASFIRKAIDSVLSQEVSFPFEIVIGDDASNDGTSDIISEYQKLHPEEIRVVRSTERLGEYTGNGRLNFLRNIRACRGEFVAILEGDDYWCSSSKLAHQLQFLQSKPHANSCVCHHMELRSDELIDVDPPYMNAEYLTTSHILTGNQIATAGTVFRRDFLQRAEPKILNLPFGDWPLHFLSTLTADIVVHREICAVYRRHAGGIHGHLINTPWKAVSDYEAVYNFFYNEVSESHRPLVEECRVLALNRLCGSKTNGSRSKKHSVSSMSSSRRIGKLVLRKLKNAAKSVLSLFRDAS